MKKSFFVATSIALVLTASLIAGCSGGGSSDSAGGTSTVLVGNPGNIADPSTGYGAVSYAFRMSKYKVTIAQYAEFLNAVASVQGSRSDAGWGVIKGLYKCEMDEKKSDCIRFNSQDPGQLIERTGAGTPASPYAYAVRSSTVGAAAAGNRPIPWVTWFDAARFANWMHNSQPQSGGTETGSYTLTNYQEAGHVARNTGALFWIPSEDEWYKAAYYDPTKSGNSYWNYPAKSDVPPRIALVSSNPAAPAANFQNVYKGNAAGVLTPVGAYSTSTSYYGTFDQGGLLWEWTEAAYPNPTAGPNRIVRGGSWGPGVTPLRKTIRRDYGPMGTDPFYYDDDTGFRLAMPQ